MTVDEIDARIHFSFAAATARLQRGVPLRRGVRGNATIIYEGTVSVERKPGPPGYLSLGTAAVFGDRSAGTAQGRGAALATALPG